MAISLSNLVDNLFEGIHEIKCTNCNMFCLEYSNFKDGLIECKGLFCNRNYQQKFNKYSKKKYSIYKFANQDINKVVFAGVYP